MKRLPFLLCALLAGSGADAAWITVQNTTCTASNTIIDLGNGVYPMPSPDRTHTFVVPGPSNGMLAVPSDGQRLAVAVCRQLPSPAADCFALIAEVGVTTPFPIPDTAEPGNNLWIVIDAPAGAQATGCGPYTLSVFDNGD
jgi:hypothetical protein